MHIINTIEEINSAGQAFWGIFHYVGDHCWEIRVYTDENCEDQIESYVIPILTLPKWNEQERQAFIEETIAHSFKYTIERL